MIPKLSERDTSTQPQQIGLLMVQMTSYILLRNFTKSILENRWCHSAPDPHIWERRSQCEQVHRPRHGLVLHHTEVLVWEDEMDGRKKDLVRICLVRRKTWNLFSFFVTFTSKTVVRIEPLKNKYYPTCVFYLFWQLLNKSEQTRLSCCVYIYFVKGKIFAFTTELK